VEVTWQNHFSLEVDEHFILSAHHLLKLFNTNCNRSFKCLLHLTVGKFFVLTVAMVAAVQSPPFFPPKDLEKIRAFKIRMRRFFLLCWYSK